MRNKIFILGDICPDNDYRKIFDRNKTGAFCSDLADEIKSSALAIANLECPATENKTAITKCGPSLRAEPKDIALLKYTGFDVLSLANNHILDFGMQGVSDTVSFCKDSGIVAVGAAENAEQARKPVFCETGGKKIGILSFAEAEFNLAGETTPGANHFDPYTSFEDVKEAKQKSDFLIVLYHGGIEYYQYPSPLLQKKCRKFCEAGADLVLCQHSHCIGTIEQHIGGTILYGQGNTLFGYREGNDSWNEGLAVTVDLEKENKISFRLIKSEANGVKFADKAESERRIHEILEDSKNVLDADFIKFHWLEFAKKQAPLDMPLLVGWNRVLIKLNRILRGKLFDLVYSRRKQMITMNLMRCEAHGEVIQTILEEKIF